MKVACLSMAPLYGEFVLGGSQKVLNDIILGLRKNNIESRPFLAGNFSTQPVMEKHNYIKFGKLENVELLEQNSLALPCHQSLKEKHMTKIADILIEAMEKTK